MLYMRDVTDFYTGDMKMKTPGVAAPGVLLCHSNKGVTSL